VKTIIEPFRIKVVEPIRMTTPAHREAALRAAHFNLFNLHADDVLIDLLTDSGTGAMSSLQWSAMMRGDESYAGAESYYRFKARLESVTGFTHILPTHQGRAAERILFELVGGPGKVVPNNNHFDTTRANVEHSGAEAVDLVIAEGRVPSAPHPFKGNMDVDKLVELIERVGAERVPLVMVTVTNNSGGGQPVSLENLRAVRAVCDRYRLPLFLDACRFAENAYFVKRREPGQGERAIKHIVRDMFDLADGATISAKKDGLVNIGGVLLLRDEALAQRADALLILTEGFITYGGLAGRDLEAMAQGFEEVLHEDYLEYRIRSTEYLGDKLRDMGYAIVEPPGGHAIYVDAGALCPHIPPERFPGQALVVAMYREAGIRTVEIGSVMFGEKGKRPPMELVRFAIPRRVYTQSQVDYASEACAAVYERRAALKGLRMTNSPPFLRHFTAAFAEADG
jgi:tryptophanase